MKRHERACPARPVLRSKNKLVTLIAGSGRRKEPPAQSLHIPGGLLRCRTQSAWTQSIYLLAARQRQRRAKQVAGSQAHLDGVGDRTSTASWGVSSTRNTCSEATRVVTPGPRRPGSVRPRLTRIRFFTRTRDVELSRSRPALFQISSRTAARATAATEAQAQRRVTKTRGSHQARQAATRVSPKPWQPGEQK